MLFHLKLYKDDDVGLSSIHGSTHSHFVNLTKLSPRLLLCNAELNIILNADIRKFQHDQVKHL